MHRGSTLSTQTLRLLQSWKVVDLFNNLLSGGDTSSRRTLNLAPQVGNYPQWWTNKWAPWGSTLKIETGAKNQMPTPQAGGQKNHLWRKS